MNFDHQWRWSSRLPQRKDRKCRVLAKGSMNSVLIEFEDGYKVIASRYAIKPIKRPKNKGFFNERKRKTKGKSFR